MFFLAGNFLNTCEHIKYNFWNNQKQWLAKGELTPNYQEENLWLVTNTIVTMKMSEDITHNISRQKFRLYF